MTAPHEQAVTYSRRAYQDELIRRYRAQLPLTKEDRATAKRLLMARAVERGAES